MTRPDVNGQPSLPRQAVPKGLLPSTWVERTLRVSYVDCYGGGQETSAPTFRPSGAGRHPRELHK
jgi:hypothetical protein